MHRLAIALTAVFFLAFEANGAHRPLTQAEAEDLFARRIAPLLKEKCLACHGDDEKKRKGGLDLRTRTAMLEGGESGKPVLVPGMPEKSRLFIAVTRQDDSLVMPPKENDKLSPEQVDWLQQWIAAGAPWSNAKAADDPKDGVRVATSGGLSEQWTNRRYQREDIWAYQPVRKHLVPRVAEANNAIDAVLLKKLGDTGIDRFAAPADHVTLIRRLTFDLTGLPPTPAEVEEFVRESAAKPQAAYQALVERLLARPQYGERMAQHWLDVTRYADTGGFSNDYERPHAWRYRDYVIRSFNADKPFDRFAMEQIAGDELDGNDPENAIAVGFLRMGPWEHTGMTVAAVTRQQWLDDVTHSAGVTFLGQGLRCARCHDHKFDPVPTRDYYRIQAVFASTQFAERSVPFLKDERANGSLEEKAAIERRLKEARGITAAFRQKNQNAIETYLKEKGVARFEDLPREGRPNRGEFGLTKQELSLRKIAQKSGDYFERESKRFEPLAFTVYSGPPNAYTSVKLNNPVPKKFGGDVQQVHILTGGALESPGEAVRPGVVSAAGQAAIPESVEGRRLALARWIISRDNPLTARVIVNRVWQMHFGTGLVATPNNFGKMGAKPTHPELLDYLANEFIEHGWSLKHLHQLIVTSAAYRQSGARPDIEKVRTLDARNELLAYFPPRRLSAEEIRDAMLTVSGELNPAAGGPGVFPEINWEIALQPRHIMGSVAPAYMPSQTRAERNRRTIYAFRYRTLPDPLLEVFNRPNGETSCDRRDDTTVTPQAFALFNSHAVHARALAMAASLQATSDSIDGQISLAFRRAYGRSPNVDELAACRAHITQMTEHHRRNPPQPEPLPSKVKRHMVEEMTGEDVYWEESLGGMKTYERDLMPWDASAETRALAEVCLVILNSNEFLYVR